LRCRRAASGERLRALQVEAKPKKMQEALMNKVSNRNFVLN